MAYSDILQKLKESHLTKKEIEFKLRTARTNLRSIVRLIDKLSNELAEVERSITVNTGMLLRSAYGEDVTNPKINTNCSPRTLMKITLEDLVISTITMKQSDTVTAGDVYLSHKRHFKNTNHVGKIMLKLVDEGKLERIPTKKGMRVKLPNA